jgi:predicted Zn-dependent protease
LRAPNNTPIIRVRTDFPVKAEGKFEEVIQYYREELNADSNNPVVLNNLAWILATADKPGLRNGKEAVQLATRAARLTDLRKPFIMLTLAAAYAETGQFPVAVSIAQAASILALLTNGSHETEQMGELIRCRQDG